MKTNRNTTSNRKKEHIELCLNDEVGFKQKLNGFEKYEFLHSAVTEVLLDKITFETEFLNKRIKYPFLISCMTGGTIEAESINSKLAIAASELNIPIGLGSQRQALEDSRHHKSYKIIRKNAPNVPVLSNIGAAQIAKLKEFKPVQYIIDMVEADALVIHLNALQELLQPDGEPYFKGLLKNISRIVKRINVPVIVKEVGAGISYKAARKLLEAGVHGIDVAGAGGTSWAGVEIIRGKTKVNDALWDWGLPTSYCVNSVSKLKDKFNFVLIGSGGINTPLDAAKAYALGADLTASARILLRELHEDGVQGVISLVEEWFRMIRKILFLTGSKSIIDIRKNKLIKTKDLY